MGEFKGPQAWQQYLENSSKKTKGTPEQEAEFASAEKKTIEELFSETQSFDDIVAAAEAVGEIQDGKKTYTAANLETIFAAVKKDKSALINVPAVFGLREAASKALEAIARLEYERNLENLFGEFKTLFEADDFTGVFEAMKDNTDFDLKTKKTKLEDEYKKISKIFEPEKLANPGDGKTLGEIREISEQAKAMLDAYKTKADNALGNQGVKESKEKIEKKFDPQNIEQLLARGETIKVKIVRANGLEEDWLIDNIVGSDVIISKVDVTTGKSSTLNENLSNLKKYNTDTYKAKKVVDPKDDDAERAKIEEKVKFVEKSEEKNKEKKTEKQKLEAEQRLKFESKKAEVEKNNEGKVKQEKDTELVERHKKITETIKELDDCRKVYLEKDYDKTAKLIKIGKFFKDGFGEKKDAAQEFKDNREISQNDKENKDYKKEYDDKLRELQELILADAKKRDLSNEELAKLYASFRIEQRLTLADEHDKVKVDKITGTGYGWAKKGIKDVANWYQKLDWKYKLAIAGGLMVTGAGVAGFTLAGVTVAGAGATASSVFAGVLTGRRLFGGVAAGVGAKGGLEVRGQARDQKEIEREQKKIFEELEKVKEQDKKYQELAAKFDDIITKEGPDALKKIKNQDLRQNLSAAATGVFLGSGLAGELFKMGFHGVVEYFQLEHASVVGGASAPPSAAEQLKAIEELQGKGGGASSGSPVIEKSGIFSGHHSMEAPAVPGSSETLTINKGSSIEATLRDHLVKKFPDAKNQGKLAHQIWHNYMTANKVSIIEKVGQGEYDKMLKDGMVNVKEGTKLIFDESDPGKLKLVDIGGKISHLNVHEHVASHADAAAQPIAEAAAPAVENVANDAAGSVPVADSTPYNIGTIPSEPYNPFGNPASYGDHLAVGNEVDPEIDTAGLVYADGHQRVISSTEKIIFEFVDKRPFIQNNHREGLHAVRKIFFPNAREYNLHKGANVYETMQRYKASLSPKGRRIAEVLLKSKEFAPSDKDINVEKWTREITSKLAA